MTRCGFIDYFSTDFSVSEVEMFKSGIMAIAVLVDWNQKWPYLDERVELMGSDSEPVVSSMPVTR